MFGAAQRPNFTLVLVLAAVRGGLRRLEMSGRVSYAVPNLWHLWGRDPMLGATSTCASVGR